MIKRDLAIILGGILMIAAGIGNLIDGAITEALMFGALYLVIIGVYVALRRRSVAR